MPPSHDQGRQCWWTCRSLPIWDIRCTPNNLHMFKNQIARFKDARIFISFIFTVPNYWLLLQLHIVLLSKLESGLDYIAYQ